MTVELIMTQGSRAGTAAPILPGYYLVGRHKECQIRPKSRSVSRRHCLLLHNEDGFGALDLKSTSGTFVNGQRIHPHVWRVLTDGDEIRFGKVVFSVSIKQPAFASGGDDSSVVSESGAVDSADIEAPESWQNFDVADFLADEDQAEMEERYGKIRLRDQQSSQHDVDLEDDDDFDPSVFSDDDIGVVKANDTIVGDVAAEDTGTGDSDKAIEVDSAPKKRPPKRSLDPKEYKRREKRSFSLPSISLGTSGDGFDLKLVGVVFIAAATLGLLGYQVYQFQSGPSIEIRQDLD